MHPELLSLCLFMFVTSCSPGPNNILASYSGFNFGLIKTIPHMFGVIFGFTTLVIVMNFGLINIFKNFPVMQEILIYTGTIFLIYKIIFYMNNFCVLSLSYSFCNSPMEYNSKPHILFNLFQTLEYIG